VRLLPILLLLSVPGELYKRLLYLQKGGLDRVYLLCHVVYPLVGLVDSPICLVYPSILFRLCVGWFYLTCPQVRRPLTSRLSAHS